jgi:hypothetical protein
MASALKEALNPIAESFGVLAESFSVLCTRLLPPVIPNGIQSIGQSSAATAILPSTSTISTSTTSNEDQHSVELTQYQSPNEEDSFEWGNFRVSSLSKLLTSLENPGANGDYNSILEQSSDLKEIFVAVTSSTESRLDFPKLNHYNDYPESLKLATKYFKSNSGFLNNTATWKFPSMVMIVHPLFTFNSS